MRRAARHGFLLLAALLCLTAGTAARACADGCWERPEPTAVRLEPEAAVRLLEKDHAAGEPALRQEEADGSDFEEAWEAFRDGVLEGADYVDLSGYGLPYCGETTALFVRAVNHAPELFALRAWQYYYYDDGPAPLLAGIAPVYAETFTGADGAVDPIRYEAAREVYADGVRGIVEQVNPAWSDVEQLLFVHDWLAVHFEYDEDYEIRDAWGFFAEGKGVCQAYAMAYMAVLQALDFDVSYVESDHLNHMWNLVKVDDSWYHVDVTWDDPTRDIPGFARHRYFLLDDLSSWLRHRHDGVESTETPGHELDWVYGVDVLCRDARYLDAVWSGAVSPFLFAEGEDLWYFVDSGGLRSWDGESWKAPEPLDRFGDVRVDVPGGWYLYPDQPECGGLALYDGKLYYNSRYTLRSYDLKTGAAELLLELPPQEQRILIGLRIDDGILTYETDSAENGRQSGEIVVRSKLIPVGGDVYRYCVEAGKLELSVNRGSVLMAAYDENGAMSAMRVCETSGVYELPEGQVCLFAVEGGQGWTPLCTGVSL